ncbi:MAG: methyltransferase domain-containing protein, partial [Pseudonocardiaceae bacterium]
MTAGAALAMSTRARRRELVRGLRREGALADRHWLDAFLTVPRHAFLNTFFLPDERGWIAIRRGDPGWLDHVYADSVLVTQLDGDITRWETAREHGPVDGTPTSSSSMPSIMAIMLEELLVGAGMTVLEIGTGTGYNAAILCARLGDTLVSTVDVDATLMRPARDALRQCGYHPACEVADGARGLPARAPFDRVLFTCSVSHIPPALLEQIRPGGLIVTTLNRPIGAGLVRVTVGENGHGHGRVLPGDGRFMPLREHRLVDARQVVDRLSPAEPGAAMPTAIPISAVLRPSSPFEFFAGLALPGVMPVQSLDDEPDTYLVHGDGSWVCHYPWRGGYAVDQGGPRRLWDDLEAGYARWQDLGKPTRSRFGITVDTDGQHLWLDVSDSEHR